MLSLGLIKKRTTPAVWLLTVLLAFAPLGRHAVGAVLCIGQDGHVAAEGISGSACGSPHETTARVSLPDAQDEASPTATSHGSRCADIPFGSGGDADCSSFKGERGPSAQVHLPVVAVLPALTAREDSVHAHPVQVAASDAAPPLLSAVQSTVLLL